MGKSLKGLTKRIPALRSFFEEALSSEQETSEYAEHGHLEEGGVEGYDGRFIDLARELEQVGAGVFMVGRRGRPSRLEWSRDLQDIARDALGEASERSQDRREQSLEHSVSLPGQRTARLVLPQSLSSQEAEIVIAYVRAIVPPRDG